MKKKLIATVLCAAMVVTAAGCGHTASGSDAGASSAAGSSTAAEASGSSQTSASSEAGSTEASGDKTYKIGIIQQLEHPALDKATEGFKKALTDEFGDKVTFDYENAQGEQANCTMIANNFVSSKEDLIMANATSALIAASQATGDIPIVGTSVTDYVTAGVVDSNDKPGRNVTGCSDLAPVDQQIKLLEQVDPDAKNVAIVYCSAEPNSVFQAQLAEKYLDADGIKWKEFTASDSNEVQAIIKSATQECDCIYIPTDNTMANNMELVKNVAVPAGIPIICGEENMCKTGGLATLSISYYDLGVKAGEMAIDILKNGKNPADMPIEFVSDNITPEYNPDVAKALKWDDKNLEGLTAIDMSE